MVQVQFDEQNDVARRVNPQQTSLVSGLFMKLGLKSQTQANIAMIVVSLACFALTAYLILN